MWYLIVLLASVPRLAYMNQNKQVKTVYVDNFGNIQGMYCS